MNVRRVAAIALLTLALAGAPCFAGSVHLTGSLSADFLRGTSVQTIIGTFADPDQPLFAGVGWEVIIGKVGFGGEYLASFIRQPGSGLWWADWYAQPVFLSYHPLRQGYFLDPFVQAGLGCAGRVFLHEWMGAPRNNLFLSIFPFIAAGLDLNLDGVLVGTKISYAPFMTAPPATDFDKYPLGSVQVTLSVGVALNWY